MELILNTYGAYLLKHNNAFAVVTKDGKQVIPPEKIKAIYISRGIKLSSDAALLALRHGIDLLFTGKSGEPEGRLWSGKFGSISVLRRKQLDFTFSKEAVVWIKKLIFAKMDRQVAILLSLQTNQPETEALKDKTIRRISDYQTKVNTLNAEFVNEIAPTLRGWEGAASKIYFECISAHLPQQYRFKNRSQHPATDAFNCLLNYGYGILYGKVEGALIRSGLDPYIGIFHREDYNRPVLVFDVIELFRVWIDFIAIRLCAEECVTTDWFEINPDGSVWLAALGKRILIQSVNDYLDEIIVLDGTSRTRSTHITLEARNLASLIMKLPSFNRKPE